MSENKVNRDIEKVSLFLYCHRCKCIDEKWSLKCSNCKSFRDFKIKKSTEKEVGGWMWKGK